MIDQLLNYLIDNYVNDQLLNHLINNHVNDQSYILNFTNHHYEVEDHIVILEFFDVCRTNIKDLLDEHLKIEVGMQNLVAGVSAITIKKALKIDGSDIIENIELKLKQIISAYEKLKQSNLISDPNHIFNLADQILQISLVIAFITIYHIDYIRIKYMDFDKCCIFEIFNDFPLSYGNYTINISNLEIKPPSITDEPKLIYDYQLKFRTLHVPLVGICQKLYAHSQYEITHESTWSKISKVLMNIF